MTVALKQRQLYILVSFISFLVTVVAVHRYFKADYGEIAARHSNLGGDPPPEASLIADTSSNPSSGPIPSSTLKNEVTDLVRRMIQAYAAGDLDLFAQLREKLADYGNSIQWILKDLAESTKDRDELVQLLSLLVEVGSSELSPYLAQFVWGNGRLGPENFSVGLLIAKRLGGWKQLDKIPGLQSVLTGNAPPQLKKILIEQIPTLGPEKAESILLAVLFDSTLADQLGVLGESLSKVGSPGAAEALLQRWLAVWNEKLPGLEASVMLYYLGKFDPAICSKAYEQFVRDEKNPSKKNLFVASVLSGMPEDLRNRFVADIFSAGDWTLQQQTLMVLQKGNDPRSRELISQLMSTLTDPERILTAANLLTRRGDWADLQSVVIDRYQNCPTESSRMKLGAVLARGDSLPDALSKQLYQDAVKSLDHADPGVANSAILIATALAGQQNDPIDICSSYYDRYSNRPGVAENLARALSPYSVDPKARIVLTDIAKNSESELASVRAYQSLLNTASGVEWDQAAEVATSTARTSIVSMFVHQMTTEATDESLLRARTAVEQNRSLPPAFRAEMLNMIETGGKNR